MLQSATLEFLRQLVRNNNKPWFDAHRKEYEAAKEDFDQFVTQLLQAMSPLEPALAGQQAKDCTYRLYRDVRFSKDKTPYKNHFGAFFSRGGRKWEGAGYYLHLEPGKIFAGGGLWAPEPALLKAVRQEIDYDFNGFQTLLADRSFKKYFPKINGERLQKAPQGYAPENPAMEYLKLKSFTVGHELADEVLTGKKAINQVTGVFKALQPFVDFLNRAIG